jgi:serine/threonine protein kinase
VCGSSRDKKRFKNGTLFFLTSSPKVLFGATLASGVNDVRAAKLAANNEKDSFINSPKAALTENIPQTNLKKNQKIGEFQIIEKIGAGGMGKIYPAKDLCLNQQVALKFLTLTDANSNRRIFRADS